MVAAHLWALRAAAKHGIEAVYVPPPTDDLEDRPDVKSKTGGRDLDGVGNNNLIIIERNSKQLFMKFKN